MTMIAVAVFPSRLVAIDRATMQFHDQLLSTATTVSTLPEELPRLVGLCQLIALLSHMNFYVTRLVFNKE